MMKKNLLGILFCIIALTSCKKEGTKNEELPVLIETSQNFSVELHVIAQEEDNFAVYYTEDKSINFNGDNAAWSGVLAQSTSQTVMINLPEEILPTNLRIDFGINKEQTDIVLEKLKFDYLGKSFESKGSDFLKYFIPNDAIKTEIDESKGTIKFLINAQNSSTPFYYPQQAVLDEISKLTQ